MDQTTKRARSLGRLWRRAAWILAALMLCPTAANGQGLGDLFGKKKKSSGGSKSIFGTRQPTEIWTIECAALLSPSHQTDAETMARALRKVPSLRGREVWVSHEKSESRVFCGEYELNYEKKAGSRSAEGDEVIVLSDELRQDLEIIRKLSFSDEFRFPFFHARPVRRPEPDVGPPEWDLRNARGFYTLHIGVTYPTSTLQDYKAAAIEWVKDLRGRGYQAYYYHDPERPQTSICVGTFGPEALTRDKDGKEIYSESVKRLRGSEKEFQYNLENGHIIRRLAFNRDTKKREQMPNWSFLVKIPQPGEKVGWHGWNEEE